MINGSILDDMDFEKRMAAMADRQLLEFVARQTFEFAQKNKSYDKRLADLESGDRKMSGFIGAISGTVTSIVISIISYFTNRS